MPRVHILISIDTDPVPGTFHDPYDFLRHFRADVERFPESYNAKVRPIGMGRMPIDEADAE